jgi:NAD/NADP transhydrogenase beta subunit
VTIGLALSVPLIIIAFNVDRIAELLYKLRGFNELLWHRGTIVAIVMGIAAAILTPIWTSDLATNAQVATTVVLLLLVVITVITYLISRLVSMTRRSMTVSSVTSSAGSSVISI